MCHSSALSQEAKKSTCHVYCCILLDTVFHTVPGLQQGFINICGINSLLLECVICCRDFHRFPLALLTLKATTFGTILTYEHPSLVCICKYQLTWKNIHKIYSNEHRENEHC